jgi:catechol 2,3-dioxygenase-like lactoylglutathione lyase family enzyme
MPTFPPCLFLAGALLALVVAQTRDEAPEEPRAAPQAPPSALTGELLVQLQVADLERSLAFYTDLLGFRVTERRDDLQFVHLSAGLPGLELGLSAGGERAPQPGTTVLNFSVRGDLERLRAELEAKGVVFRGPTQVIPGKVRLAAFTDPDGYVLRLAGDP